MPLEYWRKTPLTYYGYPVVENPLNKEFAYQPAVETYVLFPPDHWDVITNIIAARTGTILAAQIGTENATEVDIEDFDIELMAEVLKVYLGRCPQCGGYCNGRKHGYTTQKR